MDEEPLDFPSSGTPLMIEKLFRVSAPLNKIITETGQWRWYQPDTKYSAPVDALVEQILEHFQTGPKPLESFSCEGESHELIRATLSQLVSAGFLQCEAAAARHSLLNLEFAEGVELVPCSPTLFNAPRLEYEPAADIVVLGVRYAGGGPDPDVAHGPALLRSLARTFVYQVTQNGIPVGFFDLRRRRPLLEGLRIADAGDYVPSQQNSAFSDVAPAIAATARSLWSDGRPLISLGGDHSITGAILSAAPAPALQVVQLDAHLDLDWPQEAELDHATVMSAVCELPGVKKLIQIAVRGYDDRRFERRLRMYSDKLVYASMETISEVVDPTLPCYVTFDVDSLATSLSLGTYHVSPGGLSFAEMTELLEFVAGAAPVLGLDIVELSPSRDVRGITGHVALMALLSYMDGWWRKAKATRRSAK